MGSAAASAVIARLYSSKREINQSYSDCEEYFRRGKGCLSLEMVSKYNIDIFLTSRVFHVFTLKSVEIGVRRYRELHSKWRGNRYFKRIR
jgi:hypothetical protein